MVLQVLTSVVYDVTQHSWTAVSIVAKYYLVGVAAYLYSEKGLTKENFEDKLVEDGRLILAGVVAAGTLLYLLSLELNPLVKVLSELVALVYLGFLFWDY
jgi:ribulose 1,5-bisphosphate synthetase/thiazole synthase